MESDLDHMVNVFQQQNRQTILNTYPQTNPRCGITNVNNMTGDERMGVMFLLTMMLLNEEIWETIDSKPLFGTYYKSDEDDEDEKSK